MKHLLLTLVGCLFLAASADAARNRINPAVHFSSAPASAGGGGGGSDLAIDTVTVGRVTDTTLNISHTFGASANGVCVFPLITDSGGVSGVTCNSVSLTKVGNTPRTDAYVGGYAYCGAWSGGAGSFTCTVTRGNTAPTAAAVISFSGMDTTNLIRSSGSISDISTSAESLSTGAFTTANKNILIFYTGTAANKVFTLGGGETERGRTNQDALSAIWSSKPADSGGAEVTGTTSWTGGERAEMGFVEVKDSP